MRKELLAEFGADNYRTLIDPLRLLGEQDGRLALVAETSLAQERLRQRSHRLEARLRAYLPDLAGVDIKLDRDLTSEERQSLEEGASAAAPAPESAPAHPQSFTFETFCVDQSNFRALTVAKMVASGAGMAFPLTVIYGPPGCGKTHLLNAIKHAIETNGGGKRALLMWSQEFLENFQSALRRKQGSSSFKDMVREPDVLLIDDIQRIFGKKATEEEALATIAIMASRGRQVILTADTNADGFAGLDERLRRQIKGATACEIQEPDAALRRKILEQRVAHYARHTPGFSVRPEALDMIAERMPVSGRELDGAVGQLVVEAQVTGGLEVTMEVAESALRGKLSNLTEKRVTIQLIQKMVSAYYGLSVEELLTRTRQQSIARPRQIAMYLSIVMAKRSLPYTGEKFAPPEQSADGRKGYDHTTVMFARDKFKKLYEEDPAVKAEIDELMRRIRRENA
ncbi:MAG: DnaA/Hda family protein [Hyphomonadaceae bacterium]